MGDDGRPSPVSRGSLALFLALFALATWALAEVWDYGKLMLSDPTPAAAWGALRSLTVLVGAMAALGLYVYAAERARGGLKVRVRLYEAILGWMERRRGARR